ncbi:alpha/beta hydrolase [Maricaulis sp.]|uniref:alpha/beta hydrolase n=1 Tax=Maricaulis sp. TaxID=1486257 RepID=UPI002630BE58|nr:alpha/beta hydrolase [Maricaulis sp.]
METTPWAEALAKYKLPDPLDPAHTAPGMRDALRRAAPHLDAKAPPLEEVRDLSVPGPAGERPARLYIPQGSSAPAPTVLFLHGGGYVIGDLDTHDPLCRRLAAISGVRVLALDYRLAPEHAFPAAVEDVLAGFDWLAGEGAETVGADPQRLAVAGDSAGGGLAAMLGQQRRDRLRFQLLIYPLLQLVERRKAKLKATEGHLLSAFTLDQIVRAYVVEEERAHDTRVSPLLENDLAGLPDAAIFAAELDPLLDEGQAYRDRLHAAGVDAQYTLGRALPHGYFNLTAVLPGTKALVNQAALALGDALRE